MNMLRNKCFSSSTAKQEAVITSGRVIPLLSSHGSLRTHMLSIYYVHTCTNSHHSMKTPVLCFKLRFCGAPFLINRQILLCSVDLWGFLLAHRFQSKSCMNANSQGNKLWKNHSDTSLFFQNMAVIFQIARLLQFP